MLPANAVNLEEKLIQQLEFWVKKKPQQKHLNIFPFDWKY